MSTVTSTHIKLDDQNVAWIDDTNVKVIEVALEWIAHGFSADEIYEQHDGHLSLAQIHAALSHYYDHQSQYDREIDQQLHDFDSRHKASQDSPGRRRLRSLGKLS
jgi:uncharacterized protein (DUF433 family)